MKEKIMTKLTPEVKAKLFHYLKEALERAQRKAFDKFNNVLDNPDPNNWGYDFSSDEGLEFFSTLYMPKIIGTAIMEFWEKDKRFEELLKIFEPKKTDPFPLPRQTNPIVKTIEKMISEDMDEICLEPEEEETTKPRFNMLNN